MVAEFLHKDDLDHTERAHQMIKDDANFLQRGSWSLFPASTYCGEFGNAGATMNEDKTLMCSCQILTPTKKKKSQMPGNP